MSTTTQVTDFADLVRDLIARVRLASGVTATENQAKRYLNMALQDMHLSFEEKLPWAERHAVLLTQPDYTTGTVSINKGSTSLTGASTLWLTVNEFSVNNARPTGKITIAGGDEIYRISTVNSNTSITLLDPYVKATASAASYAYFEDEYALASDFLRPLQKVNFDQNREISLIGRRQFNERYPRNKTPGKPTVAAIVDRGFSASTTPIRRVMFWKPPDDAYLIPYDYITAHLAVSSAGASQANLSADADEPIVPLRVRHALIWHALSAWYRDKKNDSRAQEAQAQYTDIMLRIVSDHQVGDSRPQLKAQVSSYARAAKSPYRAGRGARYTLGDRFDEMR